MSSLGDLLSAHLESSKQTQNKVSENSEQTAQSNSKQKEQAKINQLVSNSAETSSSSSPNHKVFPERIEKIDVDADAQSNASSFDDYVAELLDPDDRPKNVWHVIEAPKGDSNEATERSEGPSPPASNDPRVEDSLDKYDGVSKHSSMDMSPVNLNNYSDRLNQIAAELALAQPHHDSKSGALGQGEPHHSAKDSVSHKRAKSPSSSSDNHKRQKNREHHHEHRHNHRRDHRKDNDAHDEKYKERQRNRDSERDRDRDRDRRLSRDRNRDYSREKDRGPSRDKDRGHSRDKDRGQNRDKDRGLSRGKDRDYSRGKDRDRDEDRSRHRDRYDKDDDRDRGYESSKSRRHDQPTGHSSNNIYRVYVGGLHVHLTEEMLRSVFGPFGPITRIELMRDRATNVSRGYAFISYANIEDGQRAVESLDGLELAGKSLRVSKSTDKNERHNNTTSNNSHDQYKDSGTSGSAHGYRERGHSSEGHQKDLTASLFELANKPSGMRYD